MSEIRNKHKKQVKERKCDEFLYGKVDKWNDVTAKKAINLITKEKQRQKPA